MMGLALTIFTVLAAIAALHFYWAFGGLWPSDSIKGLINTVAGNPGADRMPPKALTLLVAALIFAAGAFAILYLFVPGDTGLFGLITVAMWVITTVFLGRGAVTYVYPPSFSGSAQPFRRLNFRYYSPLCLMLGAGYLWLLVS